MQLSLNIKFLKLGVRAVLSVGKLLLLIFPLFFLPACSSSDDSGGSGEASLETPNPDPLDPNDDPCGTMAETACDIFDATNSQREANGVPKLIPSPKCTELAQSHAADMAKNKFFSHTSPTQGTFAQRAQTFGVTGSIAENIAYSNSPIGIVEGWMNSPGHRANILNASFLSTGVGYAVDSETMREYFVQCFSN